MEHRQDSKGVDAKTKEQLRKQLLADQRTRLLMDWLADLQKKAEIWTNDAILK